MNQMAIRGGFALAPSSMVEALQIAEMLSKSSMVPKAYQNKPQDTLVAMMMGSELGLNPIQSLQNIAVINGKPCVYGDALPALVQNHPQFGGMEESFNETGNAATCTVWRKGGSRHTQTFSQSDAVKAGLWDKAGPWKLYPKRMLQMRARGFALRSQFADALAGLITREEAEDMPLNDYEAPASLSHVVQAESSRLISDEQIAKLRAAIHATGKTEAAFCAKARIGIIEELEIGRFEAAMNMLATVKKEPADASV
jgi:hypothetical protein